MLGYGNGKVRDQRPIKDSHYREKSIALLVEVGIGFPFYNPD